MSDLSRDAVLEAAAILMAARQGGPTPQRLPESCRPRSHRDAMAIQALLIEQAGEAVAGWKIGKSAKGPTAGAILSSRLFRGPAQAVVPDLVGFEAEILFQMARTIDSPVDLEEARNTVGKCFVGIELLRIDFADYRKISPLEAEADFAMNYGLVVGTEVPEWRHSDLRRPVVRVLGDTELLFERPAETVRDDPIESVAWTANHLIEHGLRLEAGQYVATGTHVGLLPWRRGVAYDVTFEGLGEARFLGR